MPRRGAAPRRQLAADPVYDSTLVTQVINKVLQRGKRATAERIVYDALDLVSEKTGGEALSVLKRAVDNTKPCLLYTSPSPRDSRAARKASRG